MRATDGVAGARSELWGVMALRRTKSRDDEGDGGDGTDDLLLDDEFKQFIYGDGRVTSRPRAKDAPVPDTGWTSPDLLEARPDGEPGMGLLALDIAELGAEVERLRQVAEYAVSDAVRVRDELSRTTGQLEDARARAQAAEAEAARAGTDAQLARSRAGEVTQELDRALLEVAALRADVEQFREQAQAAAADSDFVRGELARRDAEISALRTELADRARTGSVTQRRDERLGQAVAAARELTSRIDRRIAEAR